MRANDRIIRPDLTPTQIDDAWKAFEKSCADDNRGVRSWAWRDWLRGWLK